VSAGLTASQGGAVRITDFAPPIGSSAAFFGRRAPSLSSSRWPAARGTLALPARTHDYGKSFAACPSAAITSANLDEGVVHPPAHRRAAGPIIESETPFILTRPAAPGYRHR